MDDDDDLVVIIVGDEDQPKSKRKQSFQIKQEVLDEETGVLGDKQEILVVDELIETAERHGQVLHIGNLKEEPIDTEYLDEGGNADVNYEQTTERHEQTLRIGNLKKEPVDTEYLYDPGIAPEEENLKEEPLDTEYLDDGMSDEEYQPNYNDISDEEYRSTEEEQDGDKTSKEPHRYKMLKPSEQKSFVKELRKGYPELDEDRELLIETLSEIMRSIKAPNPPQDYFIMNGIDFECVICGALTISQPAASRHWQEKHGTRYLVCFACGVDFRSTTNLYKHEKRCNAPDAVTVLKARARSLGRKGRGRPFLPSPEAIKLKNKVQVKRKRYRCSRCTAVYNTKAALQSHEFVHSGLRPYRCTQCPAAYTSRSGLSRHSARHTDVQFICDHCSRPFKTKTTLIAHLDTHRPLRKYPCELCGRRYAQKMALQLHIDRTHLLLPPPCACQICPKRYPRMSLLKTHMLREHGMNLITRNMLYKSLPTLSDTQLKQAKIVLKSEAEIFNTHSTYTIEEEMGQEETMEMNEDINEVLMQQILQYQNDTQIETNSMVEVIQAEMVEASDMPDEIQKVLNENSVDTTQTDDWTVQRSRSDGVKSKKVQINIVSQ